MPKQTANDDGAENLPGRCFICYCWKDGKTSKLDNRDKPATPLDRNLSVVFVLRKLLAIPVENICWYLKNFGEPASWIWFCGSCSLQIEDAKGVHDQILRLEERLDKIKVKLANNVQDSECQGESGKRTIMRNNNNMEVTDELRKTLIIRSAANGDWDCSNRHNIPTTDKGSRKDTTPSVRSRQPRRVASKKAVVDIVKVKPGGKEIVPDPAVDIEVKNEHMSPPGSPDYIPEFGDSDEGDEDTGYNNDSPPGVVYHDTIEGDTYRCEEDDCYAEFQVPRDLRNHLIKDHGQPIYKGSGRPLKAHEIEKCTFCNLSFPAYTFEMHMRIRHPNADNDTGNDNNTSKDYTMTEDSKHAEDNQNKCPICLKKLNAFSNEAFLSEHLDLHKSSPYHCCICLAVFRAGNGVNNHIHKYHPENRECFENTSTPRTRVRRRKPYDRKNAQKLVKCSKCPRFLSAAQVPEHMQLHEKPPYHCRFCPNVYSKKLMLYNHYLKNHNEDKIMQQLRTELGMKTYKKRKKPIRCPLCFEFLCPFEEREKLCEHLELCEGKHDDNDGSQVLELCCPICNNYKCFVTEKSDFIEHLTVCEGTSRKPPEIENPLPDRLYECSVCPTRKSMKLNKFLDHFLFHKKNIYKCSKCPSKFPMTVNLNIHWKYKHNDSLNVQSSQRYITDATVPDIFWWCSVCNEKFSDVEGRDLHLQTIHQKEISKTYQCPECSEGFSCNEELKLHQGTSHISVNSSYICDICHESFSTATLRRQHKRSKHKSRIGHFVCEICGISCSQQHILNMHMQLHQEVRKFVCECGKSFTSRQYLRNHKFREHVAADEKINPLACKICKRAFHSTTYLQKHIMAVHEKKNRFFCHLCARGFMEQNKLNRHLMMKHGIGDLKKHVCPVEGCNKDFWNSTAFKSHLSRHRNEPRFKCGECGKEFFSSGHFRRHEQIHSGVKPYKCEICFKSFPVRNYLYIHMRSHNKKNQGETVNE